MKYFLPIIGMLVLMCCKQKEQNAEKNAEQVSAKPISLVRANYESEKMGRITDVNISLVALLSDGQLGVVKDSVDPRLIHSVELVSVVKSGSGEIVLDMMVKPIASISIDINGDAIGDTIIKSVYRGQKVGGLISVTCGNFSEPVTQ